MSTCAHCGIVRVHCAYYTFFSVLAVSLCCGKDLGIITEVGEPHSFVCFAGMVEESGALSLTADDVFE
jgi:hypothetical protein